MSSRSSWATKRNYLRDREGVHFTIAVYTTMSGFHSPLSFPTEYSDKKGSVYSNTLYMGYYLSRPCDKMSDKSKLNKGGFLLFFFGR